jgi:hypothetical protein
MAFLNGQRESSAAIAAALILALLIGGLPGFSGVTIAKTQGPPTIALNICHPLPGWGQRSDLPAVSLIDGKAVLEKPSARGLVGEPPTPSVIRASERPDTPPPKTLGQR